MEPLIQMGDPTPATPAATVLLLRTTPNGMEVFMLERHLDSDFVGGAFVFPGGKVDAIDLHMPADLVHGGVGNDASFRIAAIRETFEESGVLLARRNGRPLESGALAAQDVLEARQRLTERSEAWDWRPWLRRSALSLDLEALAWWSWWVTPEGVHRRFDTRFYTAVLPDGHHASHDQNETTDSRWVRPGDALAAAQAGEVSIVLPTRKNLEQLGAWEEPAAVMEVARRVDFARPRIQPAIVTDDAGGIRITHPTFPQPELP